MEGLGLWGYDKAQKKFTSVRLFGLYGTISYGLASCGDSGMKFQCAKEECCPLTGQKFKGRDEVVIESKDKIVMKVFRMVAGKEGKAMEIVSIRKKELPSEKADRQDPGVSPVCIQQAGEFLGP